MGAVYLLYAAWSLIRLANPSESSSPASIASGWRLFRAAMLVNILNPKVALFFLAFLPQFVDPESAMPALQILCLGLWFDLVGTLVNITVGIAGANAAARLRHITSLGRVARWLAATAMGGLALQLALSRR